MTENMKDHGTAIQPSSDWLFAKLVKLMEKLESSSSIGVTLYVSGGALTGELINVRTYFIEYSKRWIILIKTNEDQAESVRQGWEAVGDREQKKLDLENEPVEYFHLRNARLLVADYPLPNGGEGFLWRGRISDVSGFSIGTLSSSS